MKLYPDPHHTHTSSHTHLPTLHTYTDTPDGTRGTRGLPYIRELISGVRRRPSAQTQPSTELVVTPTTACRLDECVKSGKLLKTSKVRSDGDASPVRTRRFRFRPESRFFRLTEDALEYYQTFNQVSLFTLST